MAGPSSPSTSVPGDPFYGTSFVSIATFLAWVKQQGGASVPAGWTTVYGYDTQGASVIVGYAKSAGSTPPEGFYGPIPGMVFMSFPDVACDPNGHPLSGLAKVDGYFDFDGKRYWNTFKNTGGIWYRTGGDALPPGAIYKNPGIIGCPPAAAVPSIPAVPASYRIDPNVGWNAGANSGDTHEDNLHVVFNSAAATMEVVGLYSAPDGFDRNVVDYKNIEYGFLLTGTAYSVIERGKKLPIADSRNESTQFELSRVDGIVSYIVDGTEVYASREMSRAPMRVGAALYAAPDGVF